MTAEEAGAYVHWVPTHGPNVYDRTTLGKKMDRGATRNDVNGIVYPQSAVGFPKPFTEKIGVVFENDRIVEVRGHSEEAVILRDMLVGGRLIELERDATECGVRLGVKRVNRHDALVDRAEAGGVPDVLLPHKRRDPACEDDVVEIPLHRRL